VKEVEVTPYPEDMEAKVFEFPEGVPVPTKGEGFGHVDTSRPNFGEDSAIALERAQQRYEEEQKQKAEGDN